MICRICNNSQNNRTFDVREMMFGLRETFTYFECSNCGCLQIRDIPTDMAKYYGADYRPHRQIMPDSPMRRFFRVKRDRYVLFHVGTLGRLLQGRYPSDILPLLARTGITTCSKILDVGCGTGALLFALRDAGFADLTGIDPYVSEEVTSGAVRILRKTIHHLPGDERFDLIMANHSLEHVADQSETLSAFREMLAEDGICFIRVPVKTDQIWKTCGVDWVQIDAPRHFFIHTLDSFTTLAKQTGFSVADVVFDSTDFQFWGSEQYRKNIPLLAANSYAVDKRQTLFSRRQIAEFRQKAKELNAINQGDQAAFYLKRKGG